MIFQIYTISLIQQKIVTAKKTRLALKCSRLTMKTPEQHRYVVAVLFL